MLFFAGVEAWKLGKRFYFRRWGEKAINPETELAGQNFSRYASVATDGDVEKAAA